MTADAEVFAAAAFLNRRNLDSSSSSAVLKENDGSEKAIDAGDHNLSRICSGTTEIEWRIRENDTSGTMDRGFTAVCPVDAPYPTVQRLCA
jgi:hypothetical protein